VYRQTYKYRHTYIYRQRHIRKIEETAHPAVIHTHAHPPTASHVCARLGDRVAAHNRTTHTCLDRKGAHQQAKMTDYMAAACMCVCVSVCLCDDVQVAGQRVGVKHTPLCLYVRVYGASNASQTDG